ncbi:hypothetical protein Tco_1399516, partial [Tanacetum coccineum]
MKDELVRLLRVYTRSVNKDLDDALVAPADRLKIGKCNLRLSSDVTSKEATLQVVYDVLKITPFYKAFQVTADAPEIYMQEFWASAYVHNRSVRFKMMMNKMLIRQFKKMMMKSRLNQMMMVNDFVHPKLTSHDDEIIHAEDSDEDDSSISTSNDEDSDNDDEGTNVEG